MGRTGWPLYLLVAGFLAPLVAFGVLSRYRLPLAVALIHFAALALVRLGVLVASRRWLRADFRHVSMQV